MKWNSDRLIERYYDGEAERIFKESGIVNPHAVRNVFLRICQFRFHTQKIMENEHYNISLNLIHELIS